MRVGQTRKRDQHERAIILALRAVGVTVLQISGVGAPDLLCHFRGVWRPVEVKMLGGRLTPAQKALRRVAPYPVVHDVVSALALFVGDAKRETSDGQSPHSWRWHTHATRCCDD